MRSLLTVVFGLYALISFAQSPCLQDSVYRSFDFWIGEWDVYNEGKFAGTNDVRLILDSCVIQENWKSANKNYQGKSYNFFNQTTEQWQQTWVDNQGGSLQFSGIFDENKLILTGSSVNTDGDSIQQRMTFTNNANGTVSQFWQTSKDGQTWKTVFNGLYIPKGAKLEDFVRK